MPIVQSFLHYFLHFGAPVFIARMFYPGRWVQAYLILLLTMLVDLDHLLASPVFVPCRCSIGFHPLHSFVAITMYAVMFTFPRLRLVAIGLLLHMATDGIDCLLSARWC